MEIIPGYQLGPMQPGQVTLWEVGEVMEREMERERERDEEREMEKEMEREMERQTDRQRLRDGVRGHRPRKAGGLCKLEKARQCFP